MNFHLNEIENRFKGYRISSCCITVDPDRDSVEALAFYQKKESTALIMDVCNWW